MFYWINSWKRKKYSKYISKYTSVLEIFYTSWVALSAASKSVTYIIFINYSSINWTYKYVYYFIFLKKIIFLNI